MLDERTGILYDYTRRIGILETELILPNQEMSVSREAFWNQVEQTEKRKDAQVAREIIVALPHELAVEQQVELAKTYAMDLAERTGWGVDMAIHAPGKDGDYRNTHVHLLCTTRTIERDPDGFLVMGRKTREWNDPRTSKEMVTQERSEWASLVNRTLERNGIEVTLDARSYEEQGLEQLPTKHLGVHATALERRGIETEKGEYNRMIEQENAKVVDLEQKRQEKQKEVQWAKELERMSRLPVKELEAVAKEYNPGSLERVLAQDPAVREALVPLLSYVPWGHPGYEDYQAGRIGWLNDVRRTELLKELKEAEQSWNRSERSLERWEADHPIKSKLVALGLPDQEHERLVTKQQEKELEWEGVKEKLTEFDRDRGEAQRRLSQAKMIALPEAEKDYAMRKERYQDIQQILEPKREQERLLQKENERERGYDLGR
jgi:hypothetical protein